LGHYPLPFLISVPS